MENYTENRFGYLREKSTEELKQLIEELYEDHQNFQNDFDNPTVGAQKTEAWEDIKYTEEKIKYVEALLAERGKSR